MTDERTETTERTAIASKVPEITVWFWVTKALTTAMGESTSDYLVHRIDPVLAVLLGFAGLLVALAVQLAAPRYIAGRYWFAVVMVGIFGTMAADALHVGFGVPYAASATLYAVALAVVFALWFRVEHTVSFHDIVTRRRELFYWAAVIATFALGTAVGDLTAVTVHLGYFSSVLLFGGLMVMPVVGYWGLRLAAVTMFWTAYVLTRPLGASVADWLAVSKSRGGLDIGTGPISLVFGVAIAAVVTYLAVSKVDAPRGPVPLSAGRGSHRSR